MLTEGQLMIMIGILGLISLGAVIIIIKLWLRFLRYAFRYITAPPKGDKWQE